ncbi:MAG: hypothetical protein ACXVUE_00555 [Solirubrobacteraceae bacterium]
MPLFSCPICGWTTTASLTQAVRAHGLGVPDCGGVLEPVAYAGKRLGSRTAVGEHDVVAAPSPAAPTSPSPEP